MTKSIWWCPVTCHAPNHRTVFLQPVFTSDAAALTWPRKCEWQRQMPLLSPSFHSCYVDPLMPFPSARSLAGSSWPFSSNQQSPTEPSWLRKSQKPGPRTLSPGTSPVIRLILWKLQKKLSNLTNSTSTRFIGNESWPLFSAFLRQMV